METGLKCVVLKHVGKRAHKYWKNVACDIITVYQGIKSGFLYDYGTVSSHVLAALSSDIIKTVTSQQTTESEFNSKLCVITIEQDIMLVNIASLYHILEEQELCIETTTSNSVDVSENLKSPCILSFSSAHGIKLKQELRYFCKLCKQLILEKSTDGKVAEIELAANENLNLTTIFGLLIGYPVLYWFEGGAVAGNCLDMVPLTVYEIVGDVRNDLVVGLSQKTNLKDGGSVGSRLGAECSQSGDDNLLKTHHVVYSFSVPDCVSGNFTEQIHSWFQKLQDNCNASLITNLQMNQKTVTLPSVAL